MKPRANPNFPTVLFLCYSIVQGLLLVSLGLFSFFLAINAVMTGKIYSPTVVFIGDAGMVHRRNLPGEFWATVSICLLCGLIACGLGIRAPVGTARAYVERRARQKKNSVDA